MPVTAKQAGGLFGAFLNFGQAISDAKYEKERARRRSFEIKHNVALEAVASVQRDRARFDELRRLLASNVAERASSGVNSSSFNALQDYAAFLSSKDAGTLAFNLRQARARGDASALIAEREGEFRKKQKTIGAYSGLLSDVAGVF